MAVIPQSDLMALKILTDPVKVSFTGTQARSTLLTPGAYEFTCDQDLYFLQGGSGVAATASSNPHWQKSWRLFHVESAADGYVSFIQQSTGGDAWIVKRKS